MLCCRYVGPDTRRHDNPGAGIDLARAADSLAAQLLGELRTRMGGLHIAHARRVAARVRGRGDLVYTVALLHDVVEKGRITADDLLAVTNDPRLVELVMILTRTELESDDEYLSRCAADPIALLVKRADLQDKLVADGSNLSPRLELRLRRQARARLELLDALARRGP
jgi:(p)ppGpp synthase/HD superfamily hydrolase